MQGIRQRGYRYQLPITMLYAAVNRDNGKIKTKKARFLIRPKGVSLAGRDGVI